MWPFNRKKKPSSPALVVIAPETLRAFHQAVQTGDLEYITEALSKCPQLAREKDNRGRCAIHIAAQAGQVAVIKRLLSQGGAGQLNATDSEGQTALHWAVKGRHANCLYYLWGEKAAIGLADDNGLTPFHLAVQHGLKEWLAEVLKELSATERQNLLAQADNAGRTCLHYACLQEDAAVLALLLSYSPKLLDQRDQGEYGNTPLHWAVVHRRHHHLDLLLRAGASLTSTNQGGRTPLELAQLWATAIEDKPAPENVYYQRLVKMLGAAASNPSQGLPTGFATALAAPTEEDGAKEEKEEKTEKTVEEGEITSRYVNLEYQGPNTAPYTELKFSDVLGKGAFATVYLGQWQGKAVALKCLHINILADNAKKELLREAKLLAQLDHKHIVNLAGVSVDKPPHFVLVLEYCALGSLYNWLHSARDLPWEKRLKWSRQIAKGLAYLHTKNILHRDLAARNVLIGNNEEAKLTDFGLSEKHSQSATESLQKAPQDSVPIAATAPELLVFGAKATAAGDVYSLGVLMWEIASRRRPLEGHEQLIKTAQSVVIESIQRGYRETIPAETPIEFAGLIQDCWDGNPQQRPTAQGVADKLKHAKPAPAVPMPTTMAMAGQQGHWQPLPPSTPPERLRQYLGGLQGQYSFVGQCRDHVLWIRLAVSQPTNVAEAVFLQFRQAWSLTLGAQAAMAINFNHEVLMIPAASPEQALAYYNLCHNAGLFTPKHAEQPMPQLKFG